MCVEFIYWYVDSSLFSLLILVIFYDHFYVVGVCGTKRVLARAMNKSVNHGYSSRSNVESFII